jgi:NADH-quinone oxidoreductase subunit E
MSRVLAGFPDGRADEGAGAGEPTLAGLRIARENDWTAGPEDIPTDASTGTGGGTSGEPDAGEPQSSAEREPTAPSDVAPGAKPGTPQAEPDPERGSKHD